MALKELFPVIVEARQEFGIVEESLALSEGKN